MGMSTVETAVEDLITEMSGFGELELADNALAGV